MDDDDPGVPRASIKGEVPYWISCRLLVAVMCFLGISNMVFLRLNMSVGIVCMVNHTYLSHLDRTTKAVSSPTWHHGQLGNSSRNISWSLNQTGYTFVERILEGVTVGPRNNKSTSCGQIIDFAEEKEDGPLLWDKEQQSLVLGSYFWGYVLIQVPAGWVISRVGNVRVLGFSLLLSSIICLLIPTVALYSHLGVVALRIMTGMLAAVTCPAVHNIISNWTPPFERSTAGAIAYSGYSLGTLLVFTTSGVLCDKGFAGGWPSIFYTCGASGLLFPIVWFILISERPSQSRWISAKELEHILSHRESTSKKQTSLKVPWKQIATSLPFIAIIICAIANDFIGIVLYLFLPTYLADVLGFQILLNGVVSSVPYVSQLIVQVASGAVADIMLKRTRLSIGFVRKLFNGLGNSVCAVCAICLCFVDCNQPYLAVALLTICVSAIALMSSGYYINPIDIAPCYAGFLIAVANTAASLTGFVSPPLVGWLLSKGSSRESWQLVFIISAIILLAACTFYSFFASGKVQPWAKPECNIDNNLELCIKNPKLDDVYNSAEAVSPGSKKVVRDTV